MELSLRLSFFFIWDLNMKKQKPPPKKKPIRIKRIKKGHLSISLWEQVGKEDERMPPKIVVAQKIISRSPQDFVNQKIEFTYNEYLDFLSIQDQFVKWVKDWRHKTPKHYGDLK